MRIEPLLLMLAMISNIENGSLPIPTVNFSIRLKLPTIRAIVKEDTPLNTAVAVIAYTFLLIVCFQMAILLTFLGMLIKTRFRDIPFPRLGRKNPEDDNPNSLHSLFVAIQNNRVDIVRQILNHRGQAGASKAAALHQAVRNCNAEMVQFLLTQGADANRTATDDGKMETPLGTAVRMHNDEIVFILLKAGACPNLADHSSRTPLYQAVYFNAYKQVRMLLENGANLHAADRNGQTPLHIACRTHGLQDDHRLTSLLLNHGANPNRSTVGGVLPIDLAIQKRDYNTVQMLLEAGSVEGMDARNMVAETDEETDPIRKMLLQRDPCYIIIKKHRARKIQSLETIAMRKLRNLLISRERRTGRSIILAARNLPMPNDLITKCENFVGPDREFLS